MTLRKDSIRVDFITLGCPKNEADSNRMRALIENAGMKVTDDLSEADVAIVNTCSFLTTATEEGVDVIFDVLADEGFNSRSGKLIVSGCMPSRYGDDLGKSLPEAAALLPCDHEDRVVECILDVLGLDEAAVADSTSSGDAPLRVLEGPSAYVKISDGCSRFCSFCSIPFIRGLYESRSLDDIDAEISSLVSQGAREIILIGQDTSVWGSDIDDESDLAYLLDTLASKHPDTWLRVMYLQPESVDQRLIDVFSAHENICDYLDMPLQHANAEIIADMNRRGSGEEYLETIERIRALLPDVALRTTLITGYPGETRQQSAELERFIKDARFDFAGVFPYSREEGTPAAERTDQVSERTKRARLQRLNDLIDSIGFAKATERVGDVVDVLVEGYEENDDGRELIGRTKQQAPDVDGTVHLPDGCADIGDIVRVRLTGSFCYELEGELA